MPGILDAGSDFFGTVGTFGVQRDPGDVFVVGKRLVTVATLNMSPKVFGVDPQLFAAPRTPDIVPASSGEFHFDNFR